MAVEKFNTTKTFPYQKEGDEDAILVLDANGGSVTVALSLDDTAGEFIDSTETFNADDCFALRPGKHSIRVTPSSGAVFYALTRGG